MRASLSIRGAAAAGLVTLAVLFGAAPQANAEDVTIEVWSHEADEPAKVAFRELARQELREEPPRHEGQDHVVREESAGRRAEDRAARGQGSRRLLCRARPDRVHHRRLHRSARRSGELEQYRAVGAQGLDAQRQDVWHSAGGLHRRALLQQGHVEEARRRAAGERAIHAGAIPRPGQESARCRDDARSRRALATARIRAPTSRWRRCCASSVRTTTETVHRQAVVRGSARRRVFSSGSRSWWMPAPIRRTS